MSLSKGKIIILLIVIVGISLGFKLIFLDLSNPVLSDRFDFTIRAIAYSNGEFAQQPKQTPGWPLFISIFFTFLNSDNFIDYSNVVKTLSVGIATFTIFPVYLLARRFFDQKYSLVMASLFAFEPHLNRWSTLGFAEPLFMLVMVGSFYFILSKNSLNSHFCVQMSHYMDYTTNQKTT